MKYLGFVFSKVMGKCVFGSTAFDLYDLWRPSQRRAPEEYEKFLQGIDRDVKMAPSLRVKKRDQSKRLRCDSAAHIYAIR